jgi:osmotically-inducible protein OsmY
MKLTTGTPVASSFNDVALTTRVRSALLSDPETRRCPIEVRAADGTVTLSGQVPRAETALHAQQLALSVAGVDMVWTNLKWNPRPQERPLASH